MTKGKNGPAPAPDEESVEAEIQEQVEALLAERDQLKAQRDEQHDQHLRARAELDNFRKRAARERPQLAAAAKRDLLAALLPALDALDLAVRHGAESGDAAALLEGVKAARDAFERALAYQGIERIPASQGDAFDPEMHHAGGTVEADAYPDNTIVEELLSGYRFGNLGARHSSVLVAKRRPEPETPEAREEDPAEVEEGGTEE